MIYKRLKNDGRDSLRGCDPRIKDWNRAIRTDKESMVCGLQFTVSGFSEADAESEKKLAEFLLTLPNSQ
jgi:hypothetical protein